MTIGLVAQSAEHSAFIFVSNSTTMKTPTRYDSISLRKGYKVTEMSRVRVPSRLYFLFLYLFRVVTKGGRKKVQMSKCDNSSGKLAQLVER